MFCLITIIIFSILGIFSASHRRTAKKAFDCVFKRITLRPCDTGFDKKIKGKVIGKILNKSTKLARGVYLFWRPISWALVIIFFVSLFFGTQTAYKFTRYRINVFINARECRSNSEDCHPVDPCNC